MKKKVLYLDHTPFAGGAQYVLGAHLKELDKSKFEPIVVCSNQTPFLIDLYKSSGAKVVVINFGKLKILSPTAIWRFWKTIQELTKVLKEESPDLVVTNTVRAHITGSLAAHRLRIPVIWIIRDYTFPHFLLRYLLSIPKKILTVSQDLVDYYHLPGLPKTEIIYVGSAYEESKKKISPTQVKEVKESLKLLPGEVVIGFVGRLVRWKGASVLIEALRIVAETESAIKAVIVGGGQNQEDSNELELKNLVKAYGLAKMVTFTGFVPQEKVNVLYQIFDIFVHPSLEPEPFATVVVEAMTVPLSVIGTNIGGTPEIIKDHKNGLLVPPGDPEELAKAILTLIKDKKLREDVAQEAYRSVYPRLSEKVITRKIETIFDQVLE